MHCLITRQSFCARNRRKSLVGLNRGRIHGDLDRRRSAVERLGGGVWGVVGRSVRWNGWIARARGDGWGAAQGARAYTRAQIACGRRVVPCSGNGREDALGGRQAYGSGGCSRRRSLQGWNPAKESQDSLLAVRTRLRLRVGLTASRGIGGWASLAAGVLGHQLLPQPLEPDLVGRGPQAVVPDLVDALGQDVLEEATKELLARKLWESEDKLPTPMNPLRSGFASPVVAGGRVFLYYYVGNSRVVDEGLKSKQARLIARFGDDPFLKGTPWVTATTSSTASTPSPARRCGRRSWAKASRSTVQARRVATSRCASAATAPWRSGPRGGSTASTPRTAARSGPRTWAPCTKCCKGGSTRPSPPSVR